MEVNNNEDLEAIGPTVGNNNEDLDAIGPTVGNNNEDLEAIGPKVGNVQALEGGLESAL